MSENTSSGLRVSDVAGAASANAASASTRLVSLTILSRSWDTRSMSWVAPPVPAGIKRPTITFSFSPTSLSLLPIVAASVNTLVVSWKEAAEIKLRVCNEALVIPNKIGSATAALPPLRTALSFAASSSFLSTFSPFNNVVVPLSKISNF